MSTYWKIKAGGNLLSFRLFGVAWDHLRVGEAFPLFLFFFSLVLGCSVYPLYTCGFLAFSNIFGCLSKKKKLYISLIRGLNDSYKRKVIKALIRA